MNWFLTSLIYLTNAEEEFQQKMWILFFFFLPFIIGVSYLFHYKYLSKKNETITFDRFLPYNKGNLLEAYILLSAHILKSEKSFAKDKLHYIHRYFKKHFPDSYYNFRETLTEAYQNPIKINSITSWIRAFMRSKRDRVQIIYFLAGICIIDGQFSTLEINRLREIAFKIRLSDKEFDSIIAMYSQNNTQKERDQSSKNQYKKRTNSSKSKNYYSSNQSNSSRKKHTTVKKESKKSINCKILGISPTASFSEVKKAYRKLVKIHHPDRFHNASKEQQNIAKRKFIRIQQAYEYLDMIMN